MSVGLIIALLAAFAFAFTNGFHDASNAIATLVATRGARPGQAIVLAAVFNMLGPLLLGTAVADTVGGIVAIGQDAAIEVIGAGLLAAVSWNVLTWWRGIPSSSGHALVGGLIGAGLVVGGSDAINWGGMNGIKPVGVIGTLVALAVSPVLGGLAGAFNVRALRRATARATRRWDGVVRGGQWTMSGALSFSHGANDAQKSVGMVTALLVAGGQLGHFVPPLWSELACAAALTLGTALGGWRIVKTVGRDIYRIHPLEGLGSQTASAAVIFGASVIGGPVSTTQVVASSVVGIGAGRKRWQHIHWAVVQAIGVAWVMTIPACATIAAVLVTVWRGV
ncbi:MAG TPA: inorganic phosphate transporter [Solirubrobacteraceae bacterium]|nr:inorganic phosphate transporter [Solirubrobacteraceae bacterium]